MTWLLLIALWTVETPAHTGMTAYAHASRRDCEAERATIPASDRIRWTRCVQVVAR